MESLEVIKACLVLIFVIIAFISIELWRAPEMKDEDEEEDD